MTAQETTEIPPTNSIKKLDHVNILTTDLPATISFYEKYLGLSAVPPPRDEDTSKGAWFMDDRGIPVIHVLTQPFDPFQTGIVATKEVGTVVNHLAFEGTEFDEVLGKMQRDGHDVRSLHVPFLGQKFIFFHDPNGVLIELNFRVSEPEAA